MEHLAAIIPYTAGLIDKPGVYALPESLYHSDPVAQPSLSASIAKVLLEKSPRHAWLAHPRLNPEHEPENRKMFDLGSAAHALVLGSEDVRFEIIEADSFRTKDAQAQRDRAYNEGKIPLLADAYENARQMALAARFQLDHHEEADDAFRIGRPEQTLIWQEDGAWCRARLDWLPAGGNVFYDYKSTGASANPEKWTQRQLFDNGFDVQAAFYWRGIRAVLGVENAHFRFVVQENEPPFALAVVELDPEAIAIADRKVEEAIRWWRWCLSKDFWPGYPKRVCYAEVPPWHSRKWLEREIRNDNTEMLQLGIQMQSPEGIAA